MTFFSVENTKKSQGTMSGNYDDRAMSTGRYFLSKHPKKLPNYADISNSSLFNSYSFSKNNNIIYVNYNTTGVYILYAYKPKRFLS